MTFYQRPCQPLVRLCRPVGGLAAALLALTGHAAGIVVPAGASMATGQGTAIQMGCGELTVGGSFTQQGNAALQGLGQLSLAGGVFTAGAGTVALSGTLDVRQGTFDAGSSTVSMGPAGPGCNAAANGQIQGSPVFNNWQVTASAPGYAVQMPVAQTTTVKGTLSLRNIALRSGGTSTPTAQTKAGQLENPRAPDGSQAWLAYTGTATPDIQNIGVNGVQSVGAWLAEDQQNQIAGGIAYNWFARALVPDPGDPGGPGGGGLAQATPVPALDGAGWLALTGLLGAAAAYQRRRTARPAGASRS